MSLKNLDLGQIAWRGTEGAILGGIGGLFGGYASALGLSGAAVVGMAFLAETAIGAAWDVTFYGDTPQTALLNNLAGGILGEGVGRAAGRVLSGFAAGFSFSRLRGGLGELELPNVRGYADDVNLCRLSSFSGDTMISTPDGEVPFWQIDNPSGQLVGKVALII